MYYIIYSITYYIYKYKYTNTNANTNTNKSSFLIAAGCLSQLNYSFRLIKLKIKDILGNERPVLYSDLTILAVCLYVCITAYLMSIFIALSRAISHRP